MIKPDVAIMTRLEKQPLRMGETSTEEKKPVLMEESGFLLLGKGCVSGDSTAASAEDQ